MNWVMTKIKRTKLGLWETSEDTARYELVARRMRIAAQIADAMDAAGIGKKQLAEKMGKCPSEITKWLSGTQNFTSDVLAEISQVLGIEITGSESGNGYYRFPLQSYDWSQETELEYKPAFR